MAYEFVKYTSGGGSGGGSGIIDVTELPTENIDENAVYRVKGCSEGNCFLFGTPFVDWAKSNGLITDVTYYVVETLPESGEESDIQAFSYFHIYIYNDIPYIYGNLGTGVAVYPLTTLLNQVLAEYDITLTDGGYVESVEDATVFGKVYVTYSKDSIAVPDMSSNTKVYRYRDGEWELLAKDTSIFLKYTLSDDGTHYIVSADNRDRYPSEICVPDEYNKLPVTEIAEEGFMNCYGLTTIWLPVGIKLARKAFYNCRSLREVLFINHSDSYFEDIPESAFEYCTGLAESARGLTEAMFSRAKNIEKNAFKDCSAMTHLPLFKFTESIGAYAFWGCHSAYGSRGTGTNNDETTIINGYVAIPATVKNIDEYAFTGIRARSVWFMGTPETIASNAFYDASLIEQISVPWAEGEVEGEDKKWGAPSTATIVYGVAPPFV